jgi:hydroxymethylbilane synthase
MKVVIGTRGSKLALWQAGWVRDRLAGAGLEVEIRVIKTTGDKLPHAALSQPGTKGVFIKEIEEALATRDIDVAVHSLKDLPNEQPAGLFVAAVPAREDARDVLISRHNAPLAELPAGARVGTGSLRRQAQLRALRTGLEILPVRGNLDTRLRKLDEGGYDALVLAAAGVHRLALASRVSQYFDIRQMCPAVGQGALAIEVRQGDLRLEGALRLLDDPATHQAVLAERATLRCLGGGCQAPIAAYAFTESSTVRLVGVVASIDGTRLVRAAAQGSAVDPQSLGIQLAEELLKQGAGEILEDNRSSGGDLLGVPEPP